MDGMHVHNRLLRKSSITHREEQGLREDGKGTEKEKGNGLVTVSRMEFFTFQKRGDEDAELAHTHGVVA
jgi:hypothetical protein